MSLPSVQFVTFFSILVSGQNGIPDAIIQIVSPDLTHGHTWQ